MSLRTLYQTLLDSDLVRLRVIAQQWDIPFTVERRPDLAALLADGMARAEAVERAWNALPSEPRAALEDLLRHDGSMPWAIFARHWGQVRVVGPGRLEREALWRDPVSPAEALWYWGFLQRGFEDIPAESVEMAFVPDDLRLYLPEISPLEVPPPEPTAPPLRVTTGDDELGNDLVTFWAYLQNNRVRLFENGNWPISHRKLLLRQLRDPATLRLKLLERLSLEQHWVRVDDHGLMRPTPEPALVWLQAARWEQWQSLAHAWEESPGWNDLAFVPTLYCDDAAGWPGTPHLARETVLTSLKRCRPGVWYLLRGLVTYMHTYAPDFLRPDGDYDTWNLRDALTKASLRGFESWEAVEGALLVFLLTGPLAWLGLVDLGCDAPYLPPDAVRLSSAGAAFLGLGDPPELPDPPLVQLHPDGLISVPQGRRYEQFQLSRIAVPGEMGVPGQYRLTPRSLARARRQRISMERIVAFLEEATGEPVSDTFQAAIGSAYEHGEDVKLAQTWLLRVQDTALLERPEIRGLIQERLGPGVAVVRETERDRLLTLLLSWGVLPEIEEILDR